MKKNGGLGSTKYVRRIFIEKHKYLIGEKFTNNKGQQFEIIGYDETNNRRRIIKFESGYIVNILYTQIKNGKVRDLNDKNYFGVACVGMRYGTKHPLFNRWCQMIQRCYNEKADSYASYGGRGVYVKEEFLNFSSFIDIISKLEHYEEMIKYPNEWQLDKDFSGKNYYGKDSVIIIKTRENLELENSKRRIPVKQILDGAIVSAYKSISEAEKITEISKRNISRAVRTGGKAGGYNWVEDL